MQPFKKISIILTLSFILFTSYLLPAQSLTGPSGLFTIPTAEILEDGNITLGANYIDRKYIEYSSYKRDIFIGSASFAFLPFLEFTIRATRQLDIPETQNHVMDRFIGMKLNVVKEKKYLPSLSLGFHNVINSDPNVAHFNSSYIVATKNIATNLLIDNISLTMGYGADLFNAANYQFIGVFGGVSLDFYIPALLDSKLSFIAEYDADRFNAAVRLELIRHIQLMAGLMGMDRLSGGVGVKWEL